ncbi:hypothetical protein GQ53DRAFT_816494 [Thozetella sp. PMI_491]|nr:hypothetical protein GQ53DRAFT_816494 [Thozetella sp. PMI_491]
MDARNHRVGPSKAGTSDHLQASKPKRVGRLQKEMNAMRERLRAERGFNRSPPSSTGSFLSHDTVSASSAEPTAEFDRYSAFSFNPDGEGTRRSLPLHTNDRPRSPGFHVNTSAIAKTFPGFMDFSDWDPEEVARIDPGLKARQAASAAAKANKNPPSVEHITDTFPIYPEEKENVPPAPKQTADDSTFDITGLIKGKRSRAEMQPRVENASEASTILSRTPKKPIKASRRNHTATDEDTSTRPTLHDMVSKLRNEQQPPKPDSGEKDMSLPGHRAQPASRDHLHSSSPMHKSMMPTARSFFFPNFRHLPDWASGTLKFSRMNNGTPMFVKVDSHGRFNHGSQIGSVDGVDIPEEDEEIFVSLDKLQEEVRELHDHDAMLQQEAEKLQGEVAELQLEVKRLRLRKGSDSAIGSDYESSSHKRLGEQHQQLTDHIAELEADLENAARKINVHDLHNSSLIAERDEALRQASLARDRVKKLQGELTAAQADIQSGLQLRRDNDTLRLENKSLRAAIEALQQQHDAAVRGNKNIGTQQANLRYDLATTQEELTAIRQELASLRSENQSLKSENQALKQENSLLAQDHASMEKQNDSYFKEIKSLQNMMANRERFIGQLQENLEQSNKMMDRMQDMTTDSAVDRENEALRSEVDDLKAQVEQQASEIQNLREQIRAKDERIRLLGQNAGATEHIQHLMDNAQRMAALHREEYARLAAAYDRIKVQSRSDRIELDRITQSLTDKDGLKPLNDHEPSQDCVHILATEGNGRQSSMGQEPERGMDRQRALARKAALLTERITEIVEQNTTATKTAKVTRIVEPSEAQDGRQSAADEYVDDNITENLTKGSDFESIVGSEIRKLKQLYRDARDSQAQVTDTDGVDMTQGTDYDLPPLPKPQGPSVQAKSQLVGILKKPTQAARDEDTGRFSVKSGFTVESVRSAEAHSSPVHHTHRYTQSTSDTKGQVPLQTSRLSRSNSVGSRAEGEQVATEHNMTSAFFIPDITLQGDERRKSAERAGPSLSKDAREVLDRVCKHQSSHCEVCNKISTSTHSEKHTTAKTTTTTFTHGTASGKRPAEADQFMEEPTLRPSIPPGNALLIAIKIAKDDLEELRKEYMRLNEIYCNHDASQARRERRRLELQIKELGYKIKIKSEQVYRLYDVREGQKEAGQAVTEDFDFSILSDYQVHVTATVDSKDMSWNGFD